LRDTEYKEQTEFYSSSSKQSLRKPTASSSPVFA